MTHCSTSISILGYTLAWQKKLQAHALVSSISSYPSPKDEEEALSSQRKNVCKNAPVPQVPHLEAQVSHLEAEVHTVWAVMKGAHKRITLLHSHNVVM
jgi:hypothetical protein